jgi:hypothetical protein
MTATGTFTAQRSGVYRTPAGADTLRQDAAAARLAWLEADLAGVQTKARLLTVLATAAGFPASFGNNWDALADGLGDLSWQPAAGYVLELKNARAVQRSLGADWRTLLEVLRGAAREWTARGKPFVVFIGDDAQLPSWP